MDLLIVYDIYSSLVSSLLRACSTGAFRSQLILLEDNDRLLKAAYIRLLCLG